MSKRSKYVISKRSFSTGFGRVLDLGGNYRSYHFVDRRSESAAEALDGDFRRARGTINTAFRKVGGKLDAIVASSARAIAASKRDEVTVRLRTPKRGKILMCER